MAKFVEICSVVKVFHKPYSIGSKTYFSEYDDEQWRRFPVLRGGVIMNKTAKRIISAFVILLLWVFYVFQEEMAFYGIYTLVSYRVHEISSLIPYLCAAAIFVWTAALIIRTIKKKSDKKDKIFLGILIVLLALHIGYFYHQMQYATTTTVVTVENTDLQEGTITVTNETESGKNTIELDTPELVINVLEMQEQKYVVTYRHKPDNMNKGKLSAIKLLET